MKLISVKLISLIRKMKKDIEDIGDIEDKYIKDIEQFHNQAVKENKSYYIDPVSGYRVFTSKELSKRKCCGNGCRHCPYKNLKNDKI